MKKSNLFSRIEQSVLPDVKSELEPVFLQRHQAVEIFKFTVELRQAPSCLAIRGVFVAEMMGENSLSSIKHPQIRLQDRTGAEYPNHCKILLGKMDSLIVRRAGYIVNILELLSIFNVHSHPFHFLARFNLPKF